MLFPKILHRTRPVNVGEQAGVAQAQPPQHLGRIHIKRFLRHRFPPQVVDGIQRRRCARHGKQQYRDRHPVDASRRTHFRFRRWKISTAPEMAIAEYSSAYTLLYRIRRPGTGSPRAAWLIAFKAEKFGTRYATAVTSQPPAPCVILAKPRRSSARLPITNSAKVKTADISGVEKDEKNSASAHTIRNCSTMKYSATRTHTSIFSNLWATQSSATKTPIAMRNVFTTSVPVS